MIIRTIVIAVMAVISLYAGGLFPKFNAEEKEIAILRTVKAMMAREHFQPRVFDDSFSVKMFDTYLDMIDGSKRFLTAEDIEQLEKYRIGLDEELNQEKLDFFNLSYTLLEAGIDKTEAFYKELLSQPFDFSKAEELEMDPEKRAYARNDAELRELWRQSLKYETMTRLITAQELNEKEETPKRLEDLEKETREKVRKVYEDWYKRLDQLRRSDRFELYLDAMAHGFDPHSDYFSPKEKEDFDIRMSGKLEGIGARLQAEDDYTKVVSIIPGGPAWKGKELEVNDLIVQVAQDGEEFVDITGMRLDDVVQLIRGKKGTKVTLQVKKKDGSLQEIRITRDEVIIEEGKAKSVIMNYTGVIDSVGYIRLPSFYSDFSDANGSSCSADVATEIEKLKSQGVKGILLDLRYNGGGSLTEVIDMAGFFVERGPIVQVKPRSGDPMVYSDRDNGQVKYDGPLIILVNEFSVSASEILAAAMQDYHRAVIVGSPSTFGKGTVQRFYDLDRIIQGNHEVKPLGELKITTQKFYRIDGGSTQLKGVLSDIVLPDTYHYIETGEKELENAMPWTQIESREYNQNVFLIENIEELRQASRQRIQADPEFSRILEQAAIYRDLRDQTTASLNLEQFKKQQAERDSIDNRFDDLVDKAIPGLQVINLPQDTAFIQMDSSRIARNDEMIRSLEKDIYAEEAILVLRDLIKGK